MWHHLAATFDSGAPDGVRLYVNGKLDYAWSSFGVSTQVLDADIVVGATSLPFGKW
jgi:hypothetical protein